MTLPYDVDALCAGAERALCCTKHHHTVSVDAEELVALLAEFRRMQPVLRAAMEWRLSKTSPHWLTAAVDEYLEKRRAAGANGGPASPLPERSSP